MILRQSEPGRLQIAVQSFAAALKLLTLLGKSTT